MRGEDDTAWPFGPTKHFERAHDPPRFVAPKPGQRSEPPIHTRPTRTGARSTRFVAPKQGKLSAHHPIRTRATRTGTRSTKIRPPKPGQRWPTPPPAALTTQRAYCICIAAGGNQNPGATQRVPQSEDSPRRNQQRQPETTPRNGTATAQPDNSRTAVAPPLNGHRKQGAATNSGERKKGMRKSHTHFKGCDSHFKGC